MINYYGIIDIQYLLVIHSYIGIFIYNVLQMLCTAVQIKLFVKREKEKWKSICLSIPFHRRRKKKVD